ncbi:pilus assembly protein [Dyella mobilis]|nr:PilC/PilY family type IV pilus protein [Dyella mobilis]
MGTIVSMLGLVYAPAMASVTVDQQPLIIQAALAPNVMLMMDDSGSMVWDYMPDACYLHGVTCTSNNNYINTINNAALIDPYNNGLYYNPAVLYTPPPHADSTSTSPDSYQSYTDMTNVPIDGFNVASSGNANLTTYTNNDVTGEADQDNDTISFSTSKSFSVSQAVASSSACSALYTKTVGSSSGYKNGDYKNGTCSFSYSISVFQYSLDSNSGAGPYTTYYIATTNCASLSNCVLASDTSGTAAPAKDASGAALAAGTNVANWFAYYHTRVQMARSGLMTAFSNVSSTYRVGFGSIDGTNDGNLPSPTASFNQQNMAEAEPFGNGSSGTQKASMWNWLTGVSPNGGTPLRMALDSVGQYYQSSQPWQASDSDTSTADMYACRLSYTILTTDGFWNESNSSFTGPGNADGTSSTTAITGPNDESYTYTAVAPYKDSYSNTLADVAMKYWETDLQPNINNEVPTNSDDPAFWQHMTTFTIGLGFQPTGISPTGTTVSQIFNWADGTGPAISGFSWPQPGSNSIYNIADLAHAGVNGHGGFYSATSPQAFTSGLQDALNRAASRIGTGASLAANSTELTNGTVAYQANYYTSLWYGDLQAYDVNATTGAISTTPAWKASTELPAAANRNIWTYNPSAAAGSQYVAFQDNGTTGAAPALSAAQAASLTVGSITEAQMINYLRGDPTLEARNPGGTLRNRAQTPIGDIVDSQPVYEGAPNPNQFYQQSFTGTSTFGTYASNEASRTALIWVAANDGMLHAFNASTGAETYAYIPGAVITDGLTSGGAAGPNPLSNLSNLLYGQIGYPHQFYNDGQLTIADAYINSAWSTVLIGTTGRGTAEAIYALDITNPSSIKFLWERSATDGLTGSNYIGQMTGQPVIAQVATGSGTSKWVALMGNGYNSAKGTAALLQFDLATGALNVYGTNTTANNGLAAPAVWINTLSNGDSTSAYAGDLFGNVWQFTLASTTTSTTTGTSLFTATDGTSANNPQPITSGMLIGQDPSTENLWVFFGTGQYLSSSDLSNTNLQTWYGLIVQNNSGTTLPALSGGRSALKQRSIIAQVAGNTTVTPPVLPTRVITQVPSTPDMTDESGWYIDLEEPAATTSGSPTLQGERMVTPNEFDGNLLIGTTRIPTASDICNPSGSGWVMAVNPFTGTAPSASFFDTNGDGVINASDMVTVNGQSYVAAGVQFTSIPNNPIFAGGNMLVSFDNGGNTSIKTGGNTNGVQRVSWREMVTQ